MQKINGIDETKLIDRLQDGDQIAFELIFRFYYSGLVIFASQITLDKDEATEIVQDFFVRLWENRGSIKRCNTMKSYLFTSIRNSSINYLKRQKVEKRVVEQMKYLTESSAVYEPDIFVESELQNKINRAIDKLPARCGEIFVLSRFKGLSNEEIAVKYSISKRTVETQISNALKVLRVELKDYSVILLLLGVIDL